MEFRCQKKTILLSMFFAFVTMCLYSQTENLLFDRGTVINGVKWATRNVGIPGHFASSTIESGLFYLWNSKVPFSRYVYETSYQQGCMWYETCNPCPIGWRIPSTEDFVTLLDTERVSRQYMVLSQHNEVDNSITIWWEKPLTPTNIQYIIIQRTDSNLQYNSIDTINASQTIYKDYSNNGEKNCFYRILYKTSSGVIPVSYRIESFHTINYCCVFKDKETGDSVVFPLEECLLTPSEINGQFSRQRQGFYWSSTDCEANHAKAFTFYIGDCGVGVISDYKYRGRFIRPIAE